jgi:uncharacterized membrane protein YagU involved in acid resistance
MARGLLIRGMLSGVLAAFLAVLFARIFAEPQMDLAIGFEAGRAAMAHAMAEPEEVSRATQKGIGLLTAVVLYGGAVGGIFSLVFAVIYGRVAQIGPRSLALLLSFAAFLAIAVVPALKDPANPPAVGFHETVGIRTAAYFIMIGCSLAFLVLSVRFARLSTPRIGSFNGALLGAAVYVVSIAMACFLLPVINEVPPAFPAVVLWNFRVAALATQALLWSTIGISFGLLSERLIKAANSRR